MLQLLFNFILLSTFIGVVSNRILILFKKTLKKQLMKSDYMGLVKVKKFELILSSVEVKMVCSAEFQTRGIYDQTFFFTLDNQGSLKEGMQIIPVFGCPERKKTNPAYVLFGFFKIA